MGQFKMCWSLQTKGFICMWWSVINKYVEEFFQNYFDNKSHAGLTVFITFYYTPLKSYF